MGYGSTARRLGIGVIVITGVCSGTGTGTAAAVDQEAPPRVELVLDLSGSMNQNDAGGQTRLAAAKQAVGSIVDAVPPGADVGVRVYGATYGGEDKQVGCQDTQVAVPIGPMDTAEAKGAAKAKVNGLEAKGFTPIGIALRASAEDLGPTGKRRIILVSDGEDTCAPPPPCDVARELKAAGVDLTVDVVGFHAGTARDQLRCIADATGGSYVEATDAATLGAGLSALFRRQWRGYEATGTPVTGSPNGCADAPTIAPGQYLDRFVGDKSLFYRVNKRPDQILQVSATAVIVHPVSRVSTVRVEANGPGPDDKWDDDWIDKTDLLVGWNNVLSVGARSEPFRPDRADELPSPEAVLGCIKVQNGVNAADDEPLPLELLIGLATDPEYADKAARFASANPGKTAASSSSSPTTPATSPPASTPTSQPPTASAADDGDDGPNMPLTVGVAAAAVLFGALCGTLWAGRGRAS